MHVHREPIAAQVIRWPWVYKIWRSAVFGGPSASGATVDCGAPVKTGVNSRAQSSPGEVRTSAPLRYHHMPALQGIEEHRGLAPSCKRLTKPPSPELDGRPVSTFCDGATAGQHRRHALGYSREAFEESTESIPHRWSTGKEQWSTMAHPPPLIHFPSSTPKPPTAITAARTPSPS